MTRPTRQQLREAAGRQLRDAIGPGLRVLFCGINPGLYSAAVGHHFARPGNRFWPALFLGGFTPRLYSPFEDDTLPALGLGLTNIGGRATARADELSNEELIEGRKTLGRKVRRYRPRCLAVLGVGAFRVAFGQPDAALGLQPEGIGETSVWVLPSPSGLNAHYSLTDLGRRFAELRQWIDDSGFENE